MNLLEEIEKLETWNFIEEEVNKKDVLDIAKKHMLTKQLDKCPYEPCCSMGCWKALDGNPNNKQCEYEKLKALIVE